MVEVKNILCMVGTRPECIKMAPVILALKQYKWANVIVVSTGQHRDMVRNVLSLFEIDITYDLDVMVNNQTLAGLSGNIFPKFDNLLTSCQFDLVLVQGDTTSVMVAALGAFYRRIPVGHVEAGLRTHDLMRPFPEELNRVVTAIISDIHFTPTQSAKENLILERVPAEKIHITGNTVIDALLKVASNTESCMFPVSSKNKLILITSHRRENFGQPIKDICTAVKRLHDIFDNVEFVYPVHPNPNIKEVVYAELFDLSRVHLIEPVDYRGMVGLLKGSYLVLTDSGGIQEEAPALGKPVLVLRDETERPEAVQAGVAKLIGTNADRIVSEVSQLINNPDIYQVMAKGASPYGDGKAADRIVEICRKFLFG